MTPSQDWAAHRHAAAAALTVVGGGWLARRRAEAFERFAAEGWPVTKREDWRHTSLAPLAQRTFAPAPADAAAAARAAAPALARLSRQVDGDRLVFVDGRWCAALSSVSRLPAGVRVTALSQAIAADADLIAALFGSAVDGDTPAALNLALAEDGAFVRVPAGVALARPVHLVFVSATPGRAAFPRSLLSVEAGASAAIVEHHVGLGAGDVGPGAGDVGPGAGDLGRGGGDTGPGGGDTGLVDAVTRLEAGADAHVEILMLQQSAASDLHLSAIDARQARQARLDAHALSFGAALARHEIGTRLAGEGGEALLNGLYHVDGARHVDHHTRIDHQAARCTSREHYRGILDGRARGVFRGRIVVAPGAARSDALQRTDSLLLSAAAEADARPELEIYADDVKCAHGATVGRIDESALFYLRSRGLGEAAARDLLVWAFAARALERIAHPALRALARAGLIARLPGAAQAGGALEVGR